MIYTGVISCKTFPRYIPLFVMGVLANFVVWLKVSTDLFPFLILFACLSFLHEELKLLEGNDADSEEEPSQEKASTENK